MSDTNENKPKPVLIKQPKAKPQEEASPAPAAPAADSGEKRKVVVVKKRPTSASPGAPATAQPAAAPATKKPAARVVAHHEAKGEPPAAAADQAPAAAREQKPAEEHAARPVSHRPAAPRPAPEGGSDNLRSTRPAGTGPRVVGRVGGYRPPAGSGYQGSRPQGSGGYQGQGSGGYQGQGSGGYQGQGGYQGSRPAGSGYQGNRPAGSGYQGSRPAGTGYQGNRPAGSGYQGSRPGYGPRPAGGPGGPGGRPGYGGPRPGGFGGGPGRGGPGAPPPAGDKKPVSKRFVKAKKPSYQKKEESLEQKLTLQRKKANAPKANPIPKSIDIMETISVAELAKKMNLKPSELIGKLMGLGMMATINQQIDADTATILAGEYGCEVHIVSLYDETIIEKCADDPADLEHRPPIVTVMGHVDHGKTKLLDAIRKANVIASEFGGITQHIGAYQVETPKGKITFLDTPGHEAFAKMRARGSQITDIVILVVAANDGVMPQTQEAIDHAKAAKVPIIVAINKVDLPEANPDRVKTQLSELGLQPEEWGGDTMFFEISALQKLGIEELLDGILLTAEVLELTANYGCLAEGKVLESRIDQGRGIVSTVIVERGTLKVGDPFVAGVYPGKVRALFDDKGRKLQSATPSTPVEVIGFEGMPNAGDPFEAVADEKTAHAFSDKRQELKRFEDAKTVRKVTLDNLYDTLQDGSVQELKVIIKGDVHGSVEALKSSLEKLSTREVRLVAIRAAAGAINETDVDLASASDALIIGFNVRPTPKAKALADQEKVEIRKYNVIYKAVEEIQQAMEGMLAPEIKEVDIAQAEVRNVFKVPKIGAIAGSYVLEGTVKRNAGVRVIREGVEIFAGKINSLKRFKDDAKEVAAGYECGIGIEGYLDVREGDILEIFEQVKVSRKLGEASSGRDKA
jgi:translation initiation factor IF-2